MNLRRITCWLFVRLLPLVIFAFVIVRPAYGQAIVTRFDFQNTFTDVGANECLPASEPIGTISVTERVVGQSTQTTQGFNIHGTDSLDYRADFPDGTYILGSAVSHFNFNVNVQSGQTSFTEVIQEPRSIYDANGQPIGTVMIHALSHITYRDANGNGQPDPGEITANVDHFRFTCH
jgi:hypothetical protein